MEDAKQMLSRENFTDQEVDDIMRRAASLQQKAGAAAQRIQRSDLEAGAEEAGIQREFIQQAINELKAERELETARREKKRRNIIIFGVIAAILIVVPTLISHRSLNGRFAAVEAKQAQLENVLQRRHDLIPNLISLTKASAAHEKDLVDSISNALQKINQSGEFQQKQAFEQELDSSLTKLMEFMRADPETSSTAVFIRLSDEMAGAENRISVERKRYNESVADYNRAARGFPAVLLRPFLRFPKSIPYFQASEEAKKAPVF